VFSPGPRTDQGVFPGAEAAFGKFLARSPQGMLDTTAEDLSTMGSIAGTVGDQGAAFRAGQAVRKQIAPAIEGISELGIGGTAKAVGGGVAKAIDERGLGGIMSLLDVPTGGLGAAALGGMGLVGDIGKATRGLKAASKFNSPRAARLAELAEGVTDAGAPERKRLSGRVGLEYDSKLKELQEIQDRLYSVDDPTIYPDYNELRRRESVLINETDPTTNPLGRREELTAIDRLPQVERARLDRAVEQGFDIDAFHGTKGDIAEFDPGLLGATTGAPSARVGFFFSAEPETAGTYAKNAKVDEVNPALLADANRVNELKRVKMGEEVRRLRDNGLLDEADKLNAELTDFTELNLDEIPEELGQNIIPVKLRLQNPLEHDFQGGSYREISYKDLLDQARREGKDGAVFRNTRDGGPVTDIFVVFEPSQIRSRFAAFDPEGAPTVGLSPNAKLASEALEVNKKELAKLGARKAEIESEISRIFGQPGLFTNPEAQREARAVGPKLKTEFDNLTLKVMKIEEGMPRLETEVRQSTLGTGNLIANAPPVLFPLGVGAAVAAYSAEKGNE
jgi:hypothetical protein